MFLTNCHYWTKCSWDSYVWGVYAKLIIIIDFELKNMDYIYN